MGPERPRVAVEPSPCPSTFQDLAEPGPLEPEAAPVSKVATRAKRLPTICKTCNLSRLGGHCLGKRLEAIFNSGRVLQEER